MSPSRVESFVRVLLSSGGDGSDDDGVEGELMPDDTSGETSLDATQPVKQEKLPVASTPETASFPCMRGEHVAGADSHDETVRETNPTTELDGGEVHNADTEQPTSIMQSQVKT